MVLQWKHKVVTCVGVVMNAVFVQRSEKKAVVYRFFLYTNFLLFFIKASMIELYYTEIENLYIYFYERTHFTKNFSKNCFFAFVGHGDAVYQCGKFYCYGISNHKHSIT